MSAGGITYFFVGLAVIGMLLIAFGPLIDAATSVHNELITADDLPTSHERTDTWEFSMLAYRDFPVVVGLAFIFFAVIIGLRAKQGGAW